MCFAPANRLVTGRCRERMTKKFSAKHVKIAAFPLSGNSSCPKFRSSRTLRKSADLTLWHEELPDFEERYYFDMYRRTNREGWTRMKFGGGREKKEKEWRRREGQHATSEKQKNSF